MCIWDLRNLTQPMITVRDSAAQGISKVRWCPNRSNQLTAIRHDCNQLTLFTVRDVMQHSDSSREFHSTAVVLDQQHSAVQTSTSLHNEKHDHTVIRQLQRKIPHVLF